MSLCGTYPDIDRISCGSTFCPLMKISPLKSRLMRWETAASRDVFPHPLPPRTATRLPLSILPFTVIKNLDRHFYPSQEIRIGNVIHTIIQHPNLFFLTAFENIEAPFLGHFLPWNVRKILPFQIKICIEFHPFLVKNYKKCFLIRHKRCLTTDNSFKRLTSRRMLSVFVHSLSYLL